MAIDPPYRLDPFQNIVDVHWTQETAIELWYSVQVGAAPGACSVGGYVGFGENPTIADHTSHCYWGMNPDDGHWPPYHGMQLCQWPIVYASSPNERDQFKYEFQAYSAGTLYCKKTDWLAAIDAYAFPDTGIHPHDRVSWRVAVPDNIYTTDGAPLNLFPDLNEFAAGYYAAWRAYGTTSFVSPQWPIFRYFVVEDADWNTGLAGIHDPHDPPENPT